VTTLTDDQVKDIAAVAWAANAELEALHGDPAPSLPGDAEDDHAHAVTLAGVRAILDGATPEMLHETWCRARKRQGWTYGPRMDSRLKTHPFLVPYSQMPEQVKLRGRVFAAIVREMAGLDRAPHPGQLLAYAEDREADEIAREDGGYDDCEPTL
jgi:hypothetical protein